MDNKQVGSGGGIERAIWFFAGCIMASLGLILAFYCYQWTKSPQFQYNWAWIAGSAGLSMFLLRGAWFTIFQEKAADKIHYNTGGR